MRPIYSNQKAGVQNTGESAYNAKSQGFSQNNEVFESIDEERNDDLNKNNQFKRHWSKNSSLLSPQTESTESFYLPNSGPGQKIGSRAFQSSTLLDSSNNSINNSFSPENQANSINNSNFSANIDTTPLFSPSQILKLNRQRIAKKSLGEDSYLEQNNYNNDQNQHNNYHKLSYTKKSLKSKTDLNNNEVPEVEQMSEPVIKDTKTSTNEEKDSIKEDLVPKKEEKLEQKKTETSAVNSLVFIYKNDSLKNDNVVLNKATIKETIADIRIEKASSGESVKKNDPAPVPIPAPRSPKSPIKNKTTENRFSSTYSSISKESFASDSFSPQYRSTISPRHTVVSRRNNSERNNQNVLTSYSSMNHTTNFSDSPISLRPAGHQAANSKAIMESRQKEKQQLGELNDRFAGYVERVRFLEAQNKKLTMELDSLKGKWGSETKQIEYMYKTELDEARSVLNDTAKTKDCVQLIVNKQENELDNMRRKYHEVEGIMLKEKERVAYLQEQISANESEISLLKRRLQDLQDEEKRCKQEAVRMMNEIQRVSFELESEMKNRLMLENDKQSLEEELIFLKEIHAREIDELKQLQFQHQGIDPAIFFKNELSHAIKEIRDEYESLNQSQRTELEGWYRIKVSEIQRKNATKALKSIDNVSQEQSKKLRVQINDSKRDCGELKARNADLESRIRDLEDEIRRESNEGSEAISIRDEEFYLLKQTLQNVTAEYEELMLSKSDLETEIRTYRKLLEGGEEKDGLKQIVEGIEKRAHSMTVNNKIQANKSNMNRSYTVDTGYNSVRQSQTRIQRTYNQSSSRPHQHRQTTF